MWRQRFVPKCTWTLSTEITGTVMSTVIGHLSYLKKPQFAQNPIFNSWDLCWKIRIFIPELKEIEDEEGNKGIYWQINFPFFMSNRDVSFCERHNIQRHSTKMNQRFFKKKLWKLVDVWVTGTSILFSLNLQSVRVFTRTQRSRIQRHSHMGKLKIRTSYDILFCHEILHFDSAAKMLHYRPQMKFGGR